METAPWWQGGERLDVGTLNLSRSLSHLPLSNDSSRVRTEGHTTTATSLEVDDCHAEIVRVNQDLHFQVHSMGAVLTKNIGAQPTPEIRDLIRMSY